MTVKQWHEGITNLYYIFDNVFTPMHIQLTLFYQPTHPLAMKNLHEIKGEKRESNIQRILCIGKMLVSTVKQNK